MPRATSLAAELQQATGIRPQLIEGRGGVFEVEVDGRLIFSKKQLDRFPDEGEILRSIEGAREG